MNQGDDLAAHHGTDFAPPSSRQAPILYDKPLPADSTPQIAGPFPNLESDLRSGKRRDLHGTAGNRRDGEGSPEWPGNQRTVSRSGTTFQLLLCTGGQSGNAMASFYFQIYSLSSSNGDIHFAPLCTESSGFHGVSASIMSNHQLYKE